MFYLYTVIHQKYSRNLFVIHTQSKVNRHFKFLPLADFWGHFMCNHHYGTGTTLFLMWLFKITPELSLMSVKSRGWRGLVPWVGDPPDASFGFLPKRSIPKPDQHRKDIIVQWDWVVRHWYVIGTKEQQSHKILQWTDKYLLWWLVTYHPVVGASIITYMSFPYPFPFWVFAEQKGNEVGTLLYRWPSLTWRN